MKVRYKQEKGKYHPEVSIKKEWEPVLIKDIHDNTVLMGLLRKISVYDQRDPDPQLGYNNTGRLFFHSSVSCCAFLGAYSEYISTSTKELEIGEKK